MINALKKFFSKLFPKKLATETTAELPTPTLVLEDPNPVDYPITISYADEKNPPEPLFTETWTEPAATLEAPVLEGLEQLDPVSLDKTVPAPAEKETKTKLEKGNGNKKSGKKKKKH